MAVIAGLPSPDSQQSQDRQPWQKSQRKGNITAVTVCKAVNRQLLLDSHKTRTGQPGIDSHDTQDGKTAMTNSNNK